MNLKINVNYISLLSFNYFLLLVFMNQSIGLSYVCPVSILFILLLYKINKIRYSILTILYLSFLTYAIIISSISFFNNNVDFYRFHINLCGLLVLIFSTALIIGHNVNLKKFFSLLNNFSLFIFIFGILEYITKFNITKFLRNNDYINTYLIGEGRICSLFSHPLGYASFIIFIFAFSFIFPFKSTKKHFIFIVLLFINLLFTKSRIFLFSFFLISVFFFIKQLNLNKFSVAYNYIKAAFLSIFALLFSYFLFFNKINEAIFSVLSRFTSLPAENSGGIRASVINNFYTFIKQNDVGDLFLGNGVGSSFKFMIDNPIYYWIGDECHLWTETTDNSYISFFLDYGVIGTIIILFMILYSIKQIFFTSKRILYFCYVYLLCIYISLWIMESLYWPTISFSFGITLGIIDKYSSKNLNL